MLLSAFPISHLHLFCMGCLSNMWHLILVDRIRLEQVQRLQRNQQQSIWRGFYNHPRFISCQAHQEWSCCFLFFSFFLKQERIPLNIKHTNAQHQQILMLNDEHYDFSTRSVGQMNKTVSTVWNHKVEVSMCSMGGVYTTAAANKREIDMIHRVVLWRSWTTGDYTEGEILRLWINSKRWSWLCHSSMATESKSTYKPGGTSAASVGGRGAAGISVQGPVELHQAVDSQVAQ